MFWAVYRLEVWGFRVHSWLKGCPCPEHQGDSQQRKRKAQRNGPEPCNGKENCKCKGRRLIELASGQAQHFLRELQSLQLESFQPAAAALAKLRAIGQSRLADDVKEAFITAQRKVLLRFEQGSAYYSKFPWCVVKLIYYILLPAGAERATAESSSRKQAAEWCHQYDAGQLEVRGTFASHLFEGDYLVSMRRWGGGQDTAMNNDLFAELVGYGLSLVSMQRLEGRHHLVNLKMGPSRASSATTISAALRRRQNRDVHQESFRAEFDDYLQQFDALVPEDWNSMSELHRLISGHHLAIMFKDMTQEDSIIWQQSSATKLCSAPEVLELLNHVKVVLQEGSVYAVPICVGADGATTYQVMQLLSFKPSAKKYLERVVGWGNGADKWQDHVAVAMLGRHVVQPSREIIDLDPLESPQQVCPLAPNETFVSLASNVEAFPVQAMFTLGFEHVYQFQTVKHICQFSEDAMIEALEADPEDGTGEDDGPLKFSNLRRGSSVGSQASVSDAGSSSDGRVTRRALEIVPDMAFLMHSRIFEELTWGGVWGALCLFLVS